MALEKARTDETSFLSPSVGCAAWFTARVALMPPRRVITGPRGVKQRKSEPFSSEKRKEEKKRKEETRWNEKRWSQFILNEPMIKVF